DRPPAPELAALVRARELRVRPHELPRRRAAAPTRGRARPARDPGAEPAAAGPGEALGLGLGRAGANPDLGPERAQRPEDERLGKMGRDVTRRVREEPLPRVVKSLSRREALLAKQALETSRCVAELRHPVRSRGVAALEAVLPVRLGEEQHSAGP